jgi:hypothetical protein
MGYPLHAVTAPMNSILGPMKNDQAQYVVEKSRET